MLKYAYHHGISRIYLESTLDYLKLIWIKNGKFNKNYSVQTFRSKVIKMIKLKASLYGIRTSFVNLANTSKIGESLSTKLRVDKHTTSAYIIVLKSI